MHYQLPAAAVADAQMHFSNAYPAPVCVHSLYFCVCTKVGVFALKNMCKITNFPKYYL